MEFKESNLLIDGGCGLQGFFSENALGSAKTYILRGTPWTCAMKTWAVTDN